MKRLWSLWGSCALFLMALCVLAPVVSACDSGGPPAGSTLPPSTPTAAAGGDSISADLTDIPEQPTPTFVPTPVGMTESESNNIYATVVDSLLGEKLPPVVYISPFVGQGDQLDDPDENQPIPNSLLSALTPESDTQYQMGNFTDVIGPLDDGGVVQNRGVFITLGSIAADPADPNGVIVHGSIYRKVGDAEGYRLRLTRDSSKRTGWNVTDSTEEWNDSGG